MDGFRLPNPRNWSDAYLIHRKKKIARHVGYMTGIGGSLAACQAMMKGYNVPKYTLEISANTFIISGMFLTTRFALTRFNALDDGVVCDATAAGLTGAVFGKVMGKGRGMSAVASSSAKFAVVGGGLRLGYEGLRYASTIMAGRMEVEVPSWLQEFDTGAADEEMRSQFAERVKEYERARQEDGGGEQSKTE